MFTYILGAASVVVMCSAALVYLLTKYNMINANSLMTIGASTITGSLFLPVIKAVFVRLSSFASLFIGIVVSFILFLILVFCISFTLSALILDKDMKKFLNDVKRISVEKGFLRLLPRKREAQENAFNPVKFGIANMGNMNFVASVLMPFELKRNVTDIKKEEWVSSEYQKNALLEKELEAECSAINAVEEQNPESLEQYIDKAFDCKEKGDLEDALLYYMVAMDFKPQKELGTWLAAEICSIYKELEQPDKIREFLDEILELEAETVEFQFLNGLQKLYGAKV